MVHISTCRILATCSVLLATSLNFNSVSASPSPRWSCKPSFPARQFPVYQHAGRASLSEAREICERMKGTIPVVGNLPGECLQEYYDHINTSQDYAVVKSGRLTCLSPCNSKWCSGNCQAVHNVTIVCLTFIVEARSTDFPLCKELPIPASGAVDYPNGKRFWAYARFRCAPGSVLNNSRGVFCEHNGRWRSFTKQSTTYNVGRECTRVCPFGQLLLNGIILAPTTPSTQPEVKCFDGWTLKGQPSVTCQSATKRWKITGGSCLRTCPPAQYIVNGFLMINDTSSGSMALVACKDGFKFHGNANSRCTEHGQWATVNGSCKAVCSSYQSILNGMLQITINTIESDASVICSKNFTFSGRDPRVQCQSNGTWSAPKGSCQQVCSPFHSVPNGLLHITSNTVGSEASVVCLKNFMFSGEEPLVQCQSKGAWSAPKGICKPSNTTVFANAFEKKSGWLSYVPSKALVGIAVFFLLALVALLVLCSVQRRRRPDGSRVKVHSNPDGSASTIAPPPTRSVVLASSAHYDSCTPDGAYDVLGTGAESRQRGRSIDNYDHLCIKSKSRPEAVASVSAAHQETPIGPYN